MQQARERVLQYIELQQQRQKKNYDDGVRGRAYVVNDFVFLHNPAVKRRRSKKFHKPWQGPFKVVEVLGPSLYRIADGDNPRKQKAVILVPGQLAETEEGLPDGPREPEGLVGDPPIQDPPNLAARDRNRDIPPPLAQVEPEDNSLLIYHLGQDSLPDLGGQWCVTETPWKSQRLSLMRTCLRVRTHSPRRGSSAMN
ncbi:hypothetical protein EMCRGX_G025182 [Ephydatia muelleri]